MARKFFVITVLCLTILSVMTYNASAKTVDIEGPWLWMVAPALNEGGAASIDFDSLNAASSGAITEEMIANKGANVGDFVGNYQWTPGEISVERPGWLDFGDGNINDTLKAIGFIEGNVNHATSYALINIESKIDQSATMKFGSDDAIKVWLNGVVVHTNAINRSTTDYQDIFGVNLNAADNLLMVKVSEQERKWSMFVGLDVLDTDSVVFTIPENVDIDTEHVVDAGGDTQVDKEPLRNSFEYHGWSLPEDIFTDVAVTEKATYFVWKPNTPKRGGSSIPYKSTMTLEIPDTIEDYETAKGLYNNNNLPSKYPYFMVPLPIETPAADAIEADGIFTWWGVVKSFFREAIDAILNQVIDIDGAIDTAIEVLSEHPKLRFAEIFIEAGKVIYATTREAIENYKAEARAFDLITMALQNPSVTAEDFSQFMVDDIAYENSEARYLVMVPQRLEGLTMRMETYYYRQTVGESPTQLIIRKDTGTIGGLGVGDMHLFWSGSDKGVKGKILLNVPDKDRSWRHSKNWNEMTLTELLAFWADGYGQTDDHADFWDTWNNEWKGNDQTISNEAKVYITKRFLGTLKVWEQLTLGNITLSPLFDNVNQPFENRVFNFFGVYFNDPTLYMLLPAYEEVPTLPIVTHHEFQFQSAAAGAPLAHPMSLADYPPFKELPPEVQALLLDYLKETTGPEVIKLDRNPIPEQTALLPNYPNPFNPETWLPYQLSEPADVTLTIYDIQGRVVRALDLGHQRAGIYHSRSRAAHWDGRNAVGEPVASGLYFYTLTTGDFTATRKMLIRK